MDEQWTHGQLREYLKREGRGGKSEERFEKREEGRGKSDNCGELSVESGAFKGLLELVDQLRDGTGILRSEKEIEIPQTFDDIDDLLNRFYAGDLSAEDKNLFLSALYHSENFYQRVIMRMEQVMPGLENKDLPEMSDIRMQSDDEILTTLGVSGQVEQSREDVKTFKERFENFAELLFGWLMPTPKYAFVLTVLVLCLIVVIPGTLIVYNSVEDSGQADLFTEYVYDDKVPYEYRKSGLRGIDESIQQDSLYRLFQYKYRLAMSDYVVCNYQNAIVILEEIKPIVQKLDALTQMDQHQSNIRDYYFYLGVSFLALGRSSDILKNLRSIMFQNAITHLNQAQSMTINNLAENGDRENYFLGLINALSGNTDIALEMLTRIDQGSRFYNPANKLCSKLKKIDSK